MTQSLIGRRTALLAPLALVLRPDRASAAAPPAGTFNIALSTIGTAELYLPWLEGGREGWLVLDPIYDSLIRTSIDGHYEAQIAERWASEDGGKSWRFLLRGDVPFHDGSGNVTAEDVKYSIEKFVSATSVSSTAPVMRALLDTIEIVGPREIVIHLKQPDQTFLARIAQGIIGIVPKAYVERVGEHEAATAPIGTGPFRLVEHKRQQSVTLEAVPSHWQETAHFKTLKLIRVPDESARVAMLRAGEVAFTEIPYKLKREVEAADLKVLPVPNSAVYYVQLGGQVNPARDTFDPTVPWVADPKDPASAARALKVRQALNLAVDKRAIIRAVFEGQGVPAVVPYLAPGTDAIPTDLKPPAYDAKEAKRLLVDAGYPNGFSRDIEMLLMPWPGRAEMADVGEVVAGFWERNLGLKVKRRPMDYATFIPAVGAPHKTAWITWTHGFTPRAAPDRLVSMESWLLSKSRFNTVAELLAIDALAAQIQAAPDAAAQTKLYQQMARIWSENFNAVPIAAVPALYAYNPKMLASWPLQEDEAYIGGYQRAVPA